jgi:hypothetical protein
VSIENRTSHPHHIQNAVKYVRSEHALAREAASLNNIASELFFAGGGTCK